MGNYGWIKSEQEGPGALMSAPIVGSLNQAWWVWATAAAGAVAAVLGLWLTPVTFELNNTDAVVKCEPFVGGTTYGGLWPYVKEIQEWDKSSGGKTAEDRVIATLGMLDRCGVARQNREVALLLTAVTGATLLILTRPRRTAGTPRTKQALDSEGVE